MGDFNGKLHIPSRQGRSVPLAIGLQSSAWQEQQSKIEQLEKEKLALHNAFVYMDECRKEWHQGFMRLHKQKNEALHILEGLQLGKQLESGHSDYGLDLIIKALRGECE